MFDDFDVISIYSRAHAIADGVLVDVTKTALEAGFRGSFALTTAVWHDCVTWSADETAPQDESGRLWDVVFMARGGITGALRAGQALYALHRVPRGGDCPRLVRLKLVIAPDDNGSPAITVMLPEED